MLCLLLEGVTDRCLCSPTLGNIWGGVASVGPTPSIPHEILSRLRHCQPQSTARQQLPAPPHCFLYETAEGSACGTTRVESLGLGSNFEPG